MCSFIAQLVEQRTGNAEVTGSNPVEALIFSGFFFPITYIGKFTAMIILYFQTHLTLGIAHCLVESVILETKAQIWFHFPLLFSLFKLINRKTSIYEVRQRFDRMAFVSLLRSCLI